MLDGGAVGPENGWQTIRSVDVAVMKKDKFDDATICFLKYKVD